MLSSEYGWTSKQILELTIIEFVWRIKAINDRVKENLKTSAFLAGKTIKFREPMEEISLPSDIDERLKREIDKRFK